MKFILLLFSLFILLLSFLLLWPGPCHDSSADASRDSRVLLCGASTGIGEQLAYAYARAGARLVLVSRRKAALNLVADACRRLGSPEVHVIAADLGASEHSAARVVSESVSLFGAPFDILVLNHIIGFYDSWETLWANTSAPGGAFGVSSLSLSRTVLDIVHVNALSYVFLATHAVPVLSSSAGAGRIVVVSSAAARVGLPKVSIYSATKHFLDGFFRSLRHDLLASDISKGVSVSMVYLGSIATENAIANTRGELDHIARESAEDAAEACLQAAQCRYREVYFPRMQIQGLFIMYPLFGALMDKIIQSLM